MPISNVSLKINYDSFFSRILRDNSYDVQDDDEEGEVVVVPFVADGSSDEEDQIEDETEELTTLQTGSLIEVVWNLNIL